MGTIEGKVVVITGASSGAGRAIALELAERKACLVLASRNPAVLHNLASECKKLGGEAIVVETDVTDRKAIQQLVQNAVGWKGHVDVWINNAGVLAAGEFDKTPWDVHEKVVSTNLLGYMRSAHAILPVFKKQRQGILVNNISIGGFLPVPYGGAYTASKFALRGFFESLKGELAEFDNIYVVDLFPAFLDTPGISHAANYTGSVLKPVPPVADPSIVARAVASSILHPVSTRYPGLIPLLFKLAHALAPGLIVKTTASIMRTYFKNAEKVASGNGNIFNTVEYKMSTNGDGSNGHKKSMLFSIAGTVAAATIAGIVFFTRKHR